MKKKKKIKRYTANLNSETKAISFVSEPAIEVEAIALAKQEEEKEKIYLSTDEKHLFVSPILIPNKDIYRNNGVTEYYLNFSEEAIEKMSQNYLKDMFQKNVTIQHEKDTDGVTLVESWVVYDEFRDKANALGFNVPKGTWMGAFKVDSIDVWDRIKTGELRGVSVEAMIGLEEFNKNEEGNIDMIELNTADFMKELKTMIKEALHKDEPMDEEATIEEPVKEQVELEEEKPVEAIPEPVEAPKEVEVNNDIPEPKEEPVEPENKPVEEEHKNDADNKLVELVESLKAEIDALKKMNGNLNDKVKSLEKEPSAKPVNTAAGAKKGSTYENWRETMRNLIH